MPGVTWCAARFSTVRRRRRRGRAGPGKLRRRRGPGVPGHHRLPRARGLPEAMNRHAGRAGSAARSSDRTGSGDRRLGRGRGPDAASGRVRRRTRGPLADTPSGDVALEDSARSAAHHPPTVPSGGVERDRPGQPPYSTWAAERPGLTAVVVWTESIPDHGEDAEQFLACHPATGDGLLAVFDGSGGAGAAPAWDGPTAPRAGSLGWPAASARCAERTWCGGFGRQARHPRGVTGPRALVSPGG